MIKKIRIENFRCIRELEMDLDPLTVLVGPNASGKSTVLKALALQDLEFPDETLGSGWKIVYTNEHGEERVQQHPRAPRSGRLEPFEAQVYQLDLRAMRQQNTLSYERQLAPDGANLANAFASLPRRKRSAVSEQLVRLVDVFGDVDARPVGNGRVRIMLQDRWDENRWFEPGDVSDGTMFVLAFLVVLHQEERPKTICIEEPERGLHPYLIGQVIESLRSIARGEHGPATQVVLATQSAELLNHVRPEEVRFLERDAGGGVQVRTAPIDDEAWTNAIEVYEHSMGQMWLSGSLGGVPGVQ